MIIGRNRPGGPATQAIEGSNNVTTFSDAELAELIQAYLDGGGNIANLRFDNKGEAHAIHVYAVTGEIYSPEAEAVFENMPTEPTTPQKQAIAAFVDSLVAVDIWSKIDHFNFMGSGLSWPENNALTDWIAGRTAIKNGTPTLGLDGYDFNGVDQYLDSAFNPSTMATAYQLNDAIAGAYVIEKGTETSSFPSVFGAITDGDLNERVHLFINEGGGNIMSFAVNSAAPNSAKVFRNNSFYVADRNQAPQIRLFENGANPDARNQASVGIPVNNIHIASRLFNAAGGEFFAGKLTNFLAGGSLTDPQHLTLYNSLIQLLIDFDVFAGPVLARFPSLTGAEQTAVRNFVNTEVKNGNWFLLQTFYCFAFTNEADAVIDLKGDKTATKLGTPTPTHVSGEGFALDGGSGSSSALNTNFTPSIDGAIVNNGFTGVYLRSQTYDGNPPNDINFWSGTDSAVQNSNAMEKNLNAGRSSWATQNVSFADRLSIIRPSANESNTMFVAFNNGTNLGIYINGQIESQKASPANTGLVDNPIWIGDNPAQNREMTGTVSAFTTGFDIGFDHLAHYNAVDKLLQDLEVQRVLNRFATLTASEQTAVENYIRADWKNYKLMDELFIFAFTNEADCLTGFKSKTAVNNGAVFDGTGAVFAGAEWIDSNFNPSNDGVNYKLNDALHGAFVLTNSNPTNNIQDPYGTSDNLLRANYQNVNNRPRFATNAPTLQAVDAFTLDYPHLATVGRTEATNTTIYKDGSSVATSVIASSGLPNGNIEIGRRVNFYEGTISTFIVGAAIGFDHGGHNINIRELLTKLGAI